MQLFNIFNLIVLYTEPIINDLHALLLEKLVKQCKFKKIEIKLINKYLKYNVNIEYILN